jgi:PAS domain S-box-containing protein
MVDWAGRKRAGLVAVRDDARRGQDAHDAGEPEVLPGALSGQREVEAELRRRLRVHGLIDQAVGVMIARLGCDASEAFTQLCEIERRSGRGLWSVAAELVGDRAAAAGAPGEGPLADIANPGLVAMPRSADADELAWLFAGEALGWSGAVGAAIALQQPDDVLEVVGVAGLPASWARQWQRIPPAADCLLTRAMRDGEPVWSDDGPAGGAGAPPPPRPAREPAAGLRVAIPLRDGRHLLGGIEVAWPLATVLTAGQRRQIAALARYVGPALVRTLRVSGGDGSRPSRPDRAPEWLQEVVDAVPEPMAALAPIRGDEDEAADFTFLCANRAAVALLGSGSHDIAGRRLLAVVPWAAVSGAFASIRQAFVTGAPYRDDAHGYVHDSGGGRRRVVIGLTASRVGGDILLLGLRLPGERSGWPASAAAVPDSGLIERLSQAGFWEWDVPGGLVRWSPAALMILGADASAAATPVGMPPFAPHPDDAVAAGRAMSALGRDGRACELEFRIVEAGGAVRHVRLAGEPVAGPGGAPALVAGVVQDVTSRRREKVALEVAQVQVAAQRGRAEAERQMAALLQQIIMPAGPVRLPGAAGVDIAARYCPASAAAGVGGDWYGIFPLPGPRVLLTIGDVAGHGLSAASAMAQLHHGLHGLAHIGAGPAKLLGYLNVMACAQPSLTLASACCALYDPARRRLRWASAGHPSPVLVRAGTAERMAPLGGTMVGADPECRYSEGALDVAGGDVLLLYTDGLVERRSGAEDDIRLLAAAAGPEDDLERYVDRVLSRCRSDTDDDTCLIAARFG